MLTDEIHIVRRGERAEQMGILEIVALGERRGRKCVRYRIDRRDLFGVVGEHELFAWVEAAKREHDLRAAVDGRRVDDVKAIVRDDRQRRLAGLIRVARRRPDDIADGQAESDSCCRR